MSQRNRKGQLFTSDAVFALIFIFALLGLYLSTSKDISLRLGSDSARISLADAAETGMNALLSSDAAAVPASLKTYDGFLSAKRLSDFTSLASADAEKSRELLGLYRQGGGYDFSLAVGDFKGNELGGASSGQQPAAKSSLSLSRFAVLEDGRPVKITLVVWER